MANQEVLGFINALTSTINPTIQNLGQQMQQKRERERIRQEKEQEQQKQGAFFQKILPTLGVNNLPEGINPADLAGNEGFLNTIINQAKQEKELERQRIQQGAKNLLTTKILKGEDLTPEDFSQAENYGIDLSKPLEYSTSLQTRKEQQAETTRQRAEDRAFRKQQAEIARADKLNMFGQTQALRRELKKGGGSGLEGYLGQETGQKMSTDDLAASFIQGKINKKR